MREGGKDEGGKDGVDGFARRARGDAGTRDETAAYDVAVCGGTLGVLVASALQRRGARVVVIERGALVGRAQEWNVSRAELESLVGAGAMTRADADECTMIEFNPIRCGFYGSKGGDVVTTNILNAGVSPESGGRPVSSCSNTTPKAYVSVLVETWPIMWYSIGM